ASGASRLDAQQGEELVAEGRQLYLSGCASCHGAEGEGGQYGPSLVGVGAASADYQLRTGRMPAADPEGQQERKRPAYDPEQIRALVAYVASLGEGPEIPEFEIDESLLTRGAELYIANCAPCHGATANGGATGGGWIAPPLLGVEPLTVAEVIIVGPGQMPAFDFGQEDRDAIVTYVEYLKRAPNPGGLEIGGIGPVPEGLVAWAVGATALVGVTILIGREWRARRGSAAGEAERPR
ncbi:MAG TPA: c-type cytochrome, partial [Candidatus Limnocylindria bacterium]|nr:c-type cytochrome [Candidatus Limnocylindria bacterium]